jgi:VWFA-related protein
MRRRSVALALTSLFVATAGLTGQQSPRPSSALHTVRIDAVVSDARGRSVDDLKIGDFELREDGAVQTLESARLVKSGGQAAASDSDAPGRLVAIYLDEYHISAGESLNRAREAVSAFVDHELRPNDRFVVMKPLDSLLEIRLTQDLDRARQMVAEMSGRRGDYAPRSDAERNLMAGDQNRVEAARVQVVLSAINALAVAMGPLADGRKSLIIVTEALVQPARRRGQEYLTTIDAAVRSANRANVSIYVVDPRPPKVLAQPADTSAEADVRETMQALTKDTNGLLIDRDLTAGMQRIARESRAYYLLTYHASHAENGEFHNVDVHVKRPGVSVRARSGFWAPSTDDLLRAAIAKRANEPPAPVRLEPARRISPLLQTWFGLSRGDGSRTRVTFVWEPAGRVPGDRTQRLASRVQLLALAPDDTVLFDGPVMPIGATAADEQDGVGSRAVFDAPPGRVRLSMKIENEKLQQIDSDMWS